MKQKIFLSGLLLFLFCAVGFSQTTENKVKKRQINQQVRINEGVNSGQLTRVERAKLKRQQRNIKRTKKAAKADGVVTRKEKAIINKKQRRANRNIARKKNNEITR